MNWVIELQKKTHANCLDFGVSVAAVAATVFVVILNEDATEFEDKLKTEKYVNKFYE